MCAKTTHVGCAAVKFGNNFINALVVCNYGPDYCTNDEVLYVDGETDTNCKYGVHEYGLCMPPPKERMRRYWVPPFSNGNVNINRFYVTFNKHIFRYCDCYLFT